MNKDKGVKIFVLTILLSIFSLCWSLIHRSADLLILYNGASFSGNFYVILLNYFLFSCYSFYIFGDCDRYVSGYGIYVVLRSKSKIKIVRNLFIKTMIFVGLVEILKMVIYILVTMILYNTFYVSDISIFLYMFFANIFFFLFVLLTQVSIEFFLDSKISLYITHASYLIFVWFGGIMGLSFSESPFNIFILPNISMYLRLKSFWLFDMLHMSLAYILFLILLAILFIIIKKNIHKKDWIERG